MMQDKEVIKLILHIWRTGGFHWRSLMCLFVHHKYFERMRMRIILRERGGPLANVCDFCGCGWEEQADDPFHPFLRDCAERLYTRTKFRHETETGEEFTGHVGFKIK